MLETFLKEKKEYNPSLPTYLNQSPVRIFIPATLTKREKRNVRNASYHILKKKKHTDLVEVKRERV
jgi:hypothetical protein